MKSGVFHLTKRMKLSRVLKATLSECVLYINIDRQVAVLILPYSEVNTIGGSTESGVRYFIGSYWWLGCELGYAISID